MSHVFGRSITFSFTPIADNEPVKVDSLVSARIFLVAPTQDQIETPATAGYIEAVTSWKSGGDFEKIITFSPVTDPTPHSTVEYQIYHIVVNFKYESTGPTVFSRETIFVYRPDALTSKISTRFDDVYRTEKRLEEQWEIADIDGFIKEAKTDIFRYYRGLEYQVKQLANLQELNDACRYRAAALACLALYTDKTPHWQVLFDLRNEQYEKALASSFPRITDQNHAESPSVVSTSGGVFVRR